MPEEPQNVPSRPLLHVSLTHDEWADLAAAASHSEIPVNTLARALLRWAWPLFATGQFNVAALKDRYGVAQGIAEKLDAENRADKIKEWLYRLYEAMPEDELDVFRGIADRIHFNEAVPEAFGVSQGKSSGAKETDQRVRRPAGRRGGR